MSTHKARCMPWDDLLLEIIPEILAKHSFNPTNINAKKLFDKTKDIKLSDLGLSVTHLENYLSKHYNTGNCSFNHLESVSSSRTRKIFPPKKL